MYGNYLVYFNKFVCIWCHSFPLVSVIGALLPSNFRPALVALINFKCTYYYYYYYSALSVSVVPYDHCAAFIPSTVYYNIIIIVKFICRRRNSCTAFANLVHLADELFFISAVSRSNATWLCLTYACIIVVALMTVFFSTDVWSLATCNI